MELKPHQQRVVEEKKELDEKLAKLDAFTGTPTFSSLDEEDTLLLLKQLVIMHNYSEVLERRIARFV